jgi:hypothetical protein
MLTSGARQASSGAKDIRQRGVVTYSLFCLKPPNLLSTFQGRPIAPPFGAACASVRGSDASICERCNRIDPIRQHLPTEIYKSGQNAYRYVN